MATSNTPDVRRLTLASGTQTATGNGSSIDVSAVRTGFVTLNVTAASGSTPSMTVKLQVTDDGGTTWYDLPSGAFTAATAAGTQILKVDTFGDAIRPVWTITGTTPSFTFAVKGVFKS